MRPIRTNVALVVTLVLGSASASGQLLLRAGESFAHEFSTLPFRYYQRATFPPYSEFWFRVLPDSFEPGTRLQYEMFANSLTEPPARSGILTETPPYDHRDAPLYVWDDRQGAIRLTTLTGSVMIGEITLGVWGQHDGDFRYWDYYSTTIVPPPRVLLRRLEGGALRLTWTTNAVSYRLESSTEGLGPGSWAPAPETVRVVGSDYAVELEATPGRQRWFRLAKP